MAFQLSSLSINCMHSLIPYIHFHFIVQDRLIHTLLFRNSTSSARKARNKPNIVLRNQKCIHNIDASVTISVRIRSDKSGRG